MSRLNSLSPDLRAALALLLRQRKRHAEVAAMLSMPERAVHDRAHAALGLLAPAQARELSPEHRDQVGEYLLGQQTDQQQRETRAYLRRDPAARAWAQALERELQPLASDSLPRIPAPSSNGREPQLPSSRTGGALLLGAIAAAIVVVVLLIVGVGGGAGKGHPASTTNASSTASGKTTASANTGTSTTSGASSAAHTTRSKALPLTPPDPTTSKAVGLAYVFTQSGRHAFYLLAKELPSLPSGTFYAVWLEGAPSAPRDYPLGSLPGTGSDGLVEGGGPLPSTAADYTRIAVTTETSHTPTAPGPTVLRGAFALH